MKKILSVILTLCMLCGLVPLAVSADDVSYDVTVTGLEYTVTGGQVGEDALTPSIGSYVVSLQSKEGVVFSEDVTVTIGGVKTDAYYAYVWYDSGANATVMNLELYDVSNIDGDVVITLKEATALEEAVDLDALSVITEDTVDTVTFPEVAESVYFSCSDSITWVRDPQVYAVTLEEDERVWLRCYSDEDPEGDTYLHVLKKDGSNWVECGYFDTDTVNELQESAVFTADADDTYYIVFTGYDSAAGDYTVEILFENIPEDISTLLDAAQELPAQAEIKNTPKQYVMEDGVYNVYAAYKQSAGADMAVVTADIEGACYMVCIKDDVTGEYSGAMGSTLTPGEDEFIQSTDAADQYIIFYTYENVNATILIETIDFEQTEMLDFTADTAPTPDTDAKWAWDAAAKTLTLKDGFAMNLPEMRDGESAILLPDSATVIMEGDAYILTQAHPSDSGDCYVFTAKGALTIQGKNTDRSANLYMEGQLITVAAEGALTLKNCTITTDGAFGAYDNITAENIALTSEAFISLIASPAISNTEATSSIYCKDSAFTVGSYWPFAAKTETLLENCVTDATFVGGILPLGEIAPIETKGGSFSIMAQNEEIDLSLFKIGEDTECFLGGWLYVSDKDAYALPKNLEFKNWNKDITYTGALTEDMLVYIDAEDRYAVMIEQGEASDHAYYTATPYYADMEKVAVTTDAEAYEYNGKIKITVKADGPAIGVYGNTRLVPASWKIGELSGTFENGKNTFEIDAAQLTAGKHTVEVTYALQKADVKINYSMSSMLFRTVFKAVEETDMTLTASATFTVKAKPAPAPDPEDNKQDDNKQDGGNQQVSKPSLDGTATGDSGAALPWLVLTVVSGLGLVALQFTKKRKQTE